MDLRNGLLAWGGNTLGARQAASLFIFRRRAASRLCELPPSPAEFPESPLADYRQRGHLPHRLQCPGAIRSPPVFLSTFFKFPHPFPEPPVHNLRTPARKRGYTGSHGSIPHTARGLGPGKSGPHRRYPWEPGERQRTRREQPRLMYPKLFTDEKDGQTPGRLRRCAWRSIGSSAEPRRRPQGGWK